MHRKHIWVNRNDDLLLVYMKSNSQEIILCWVVMEGIRNFDSWLLYHLLVSGYIVIDVFVLEWLLEFWRWIGTILSLTLITWRPVFRATVSSFRIWNQDWNVNHHSGYLLHDIYSSALLICITHLHYSFASCELWRIKSCDSWIRWLGFPLTLELRFRRTTIRTIRLWSSSRTWFRIAVLSLPSALEGFSHVSSTNCTALLHSLTNCTPQSVIM